MTLATDFLRSLTNSVEQLDARLQHVESQLVLLNAKLKLAQAKLNAVSVNAVGQLDMLDLQSDQPLDAVGRAAVAAIDAVDDVFKEAL